MRRIIEYLPWKIHLADAELRWQHHANLTSDLLQHFTAALKIDVRKK
jgi:hypothetical protein